MNRLTEIETRLSAIKDEMIAEGADIDALTIETDTLLEERKGILDAEQKRQETLSKIAAGEIGKEINKEITPMEEVRNLAIDSIEYRNAYLNNLRGIASDEEKRAFAVANAAIATMTVNDIMTVVKDHVPLYDKITVINTGAKITYYVEGTNNAAVAHTENATINAAGDTVTPVELSPSEIVKKLQVSEAAKQMSVDAFEAWIAKNLGEAIAAKLNALIVGVMTTAATSAGTTYTDATVRALLGGVKGNAALVCNRFTLFNEILPLQDASKHSLVTYNGNQATIYGAPIYVDDSCANGVTLAGDLKKVIGAIAESIQIKSAFDIDTNSYKYLGVALADFKVGVASAFGKIVKTYG